MLAGAPNVEIAEVDRVDIAVETWSWAFAAARREEIDRHFAERRRARPALWNGRVLLLNRYVISNRVLSGACFETDFASLVAWRDWDLPDAGVLNVYSAAVLRSADGAYLVGEMAPSTASAGSIYFPCGTPDLEDIAADGTLDLAGSVRRELREETGLDIDALSAAPGWIAVRDRGYLALMKRLTAGENADQLRGRILRHLAGEADPEFSGIRVVRGPADFDPAMPRWVTQFLEHVWRQDNA
jgi:8-oxo-dGTP pyrophosphatase MutT (NUDIX family)